MGFPVKAVGWVRNPTTADMKWIGWREGTEMRWGWGGFVGRGRRVYEYIRGTWTVNQTPKSEEDMGTQRLLTGGPLETMSMKTNSTAPHCSFKMCGFFWTTFGISIYPKWVMIQGTNNIKLLKDLFCCVFGSLTKVPYLFPFPSLPDQTVKSCVGSPTPLKFYPVWNIWIGHIKNSRLSG